MRNGNRRATETKNQMYLSSYRTYEEWKLPEETNITMFENRSYRTYEEWKQYFNYLCLFNELRSYRTYEEWKQETVIISFTHTLTFLPYLWGMETASPRTESDPLEYVLTVPMRNGNQETQAQLAELVEFLPYLWGMETIFNFQSNRLISRSYRTYEEWKRQRSLKKSE